jgi:cell division protein FtsW
MIRPCPSALPGSPALLPVSTSMEATRQRESFDRILLTLTVLLLVLGLAAVADASYVRARQSEALNYDGWYIAKKQAQWVGLSIVTLLIGIHTPYWWLRRFSGLALIAALAMLVAVLIPGIGREVGGARRWLGVGGFQFQPSEFAKIALVLGLATFSDSWRGRVRDFWRGFVPPVAITSIMAILVAKEDLGTAITIMGTGLCLIFMMGARPRHLALLFATALAGGIGFVLAKSYRIERVMAWLSLVFNPMEVHKGAAYQPSQGLIALGAGGVYGQGVGSGSAKHLYLPAEHTDYIFATIGEDVGMLGCLVLVALFAWLIIRGLTVAHRTRDWFGCLLASGLTCIIGIQTVLNIAVVTGLVPCTGVPLPFISYGGSSLVFTTLAVGIILNISQYPGHRSAVGTKVRGMREGRADGWRDRRAHLSRS